MTITYPSAAERLRVNMGWQCPECFGGNIETTARGPGGAREQQHVCQECGCQWDRYRYPALVIRDPS